MMRPAPVKLAELVASVVRGPDDVRNWYWRIRTRGRHGRHVDAGWWSRSEVETVLARHVADGTAAKLDQADRVVVELVTVRDLLQLWGGAQELRTDLRPRSLDLYRRASRHVGRHLGHARVDTLRPSHVDELWHGLVREGYSDAVAMQAHSVLRAAWRWARRAGWHDLADVVGRPPVVPRHKRDRYTPDEDDVRAVLAKLAGWHRDVVELAWLHGARIGEIAELRVADVDLRRRRVRYDGKTGPRTVPLRGRAVELLSRLVAEAEGDHLWPVAVETVRSYLNAHALRSACDRAGVPRFTPHGLRRAAAVRLARARIDPATAAALLGHSVRVMLEVYREVADTDLDDAADALAGEPEGGRVVVFPGGNR